MTSTELENFSCSALTTTSRVNGQRLNSKRAALPITTRANSVPIVIRRDDALDFFFKTSFLDSLNPPAKCIYESFPWVANHQYPTPVLRKLIRIDRFARRVQRPEQGSVQDGKERHHHYLWGVRTFYK